MEDTSVKDLELQIKLVNKAHRLFWPLSVLSSTRPMCQLLDFLTTRPGTLHIRSQPHGWRGCVLRINLLVDMLTLALHQAPSLGFAPTKSQLHVAGGARAARSFWGSLPSRKSCSFQEAFRVLVLDPSV